MGEQGLDGDRHRKGPARSASKLSSKSKETGCKSEEVLGLSSLKPGLETHKGHKGHALE